MGVAANDAAPAAPRNGLNGAEAFGVTVEQVKEAMQAAGFRVEVRAANGITVLTSATGGLPFEVRLANGPAAAVPDRHLDAAFAVPLVVQGAFPERLLNDWNKRHRFGRLVLEQPAPNKQVLALCMDAILVAGASPQHLRAHIDVWDVLIQQLIAWLNRELPRLAPAPSADTTRAEESVPTADQMASAP